MWKSKTEALHKRLLRQLAQMGLKPDKPPQDVEAWGDLLLQISEAYLHSEQRRLALEKSVSTLAAEIDMERAKALHAGRFATLGEMTGSIVHEINAPLAAIQLLAGQVGNHEAAKQIESTVQRIAKIVRGLRTFARRSEKDPFKSKPLANILNETVDLMREKMRMMGVEVEARDLGEGIEVECRSAQISQILVNLLMNAADAVEPLDEKWVRLEARDLGVSVEISITDSGTGIPEPVRRRLMEPFFTTKGEGKGMGLGLNISKGIAEQHYGLLYLDEVSLNTRFVLLLPKRQPEKMVA
ncbi:MAG TPA: ATP-binding protein [Bdellovibrionales bacterium]|nr:ATP-binding protein [Bdellovibrionales bacterium]